ncbi:MAG: hypothetical protein Kow00121_48690 [Elainellaceae cyanobacterium]
MTKSSTPPASDLPKQQSPKRPSSGRGRGFLVFLFRLLLLGISGSLAGLVGITIAQFYPGQVEDPPLVEKLLQGSQTLWRGVTQLPRSWDSSPPEVVSPLPAESAESPVSAPDALPAPPSPQSALTDAQRQQAQTDLNQLQGELQQLNNRASALATQVGADPNASVEEKLQTIQQQLDPTAAPPSPSAAQPQAGVIAPATSTLSNGELLKVTLPSDALFEGDNSLRSTTASILNSVAEDLRRYPGATIRVGGHIDSQGSAAADRERSFEQASAVAQYLSNQLDESYQWVVVGYGGRQPITDNTSEINRQRNRRVEIVIDPN